jgi:hypothetical protein
MRPQHSHKRLDLPFRPDPQMFDALRPPFSQKPQEIVFPFVRRTFDLLLEKQRENIPDMLVKYVRMLRCDIGNSGTTENHLV